MTRIQQSLTFYDLASFPECNDRSFLIRAIDKSSIYPVKLEEASFEAGASSIGQPPIFLVFGYRKDRDQPGAIERPIDYALTYGEALHKAYLEAYKLVNELRAKYPQVEFTERIRYQHHQIISSIFA